MAIKNGNIKNTDPEREGNVSLFRQLFEAYFQALVTYAYRFVNSWQVAEDIVQDVFVVLWEKRGEINFDKPIKPYLYQSVYNRSINYLNSALIQKRIEGMDTIDELINHEILDYNQHDMLLLKEIASTIDSFVETLPPQCRKVYKLSREEHLKNKEIAIRLAISEKAVEKQISKALFEIRNHLIRLDILSMFL